MSIFIDGGFAFITLRHHSYFFWCCNRLVEWSEDLIKLKDTYLTETVSGESLTGS